MQSAVLPCSPRPHASGSVPLAKCCASLVDGVELYIHEQPKAYAGSTIRDCGQARRTHDHGCRGWRVLGTPSLYSSPCIY